MSIRLDIPSLMAGAGEGDGQHNLAEIERTLNVLVGQDQHGLRALRVRGMHDTSKFGLRPCAPIHAARAVREFAAGFPLAQLYVHLNPSCAISAAEAISAFEPLGLGQQSAIEGRKWLLIDFDPDRLSDTNSTQRELDLAANIAQTVFEDLTEAGWPQPVAAMSGNGIHLLYRVDLPVDDDAKLLARDCLRALNSAYGTHELHVDESVFDSSRVTRLYGSINRKGLHTSERPQRLSRLLFVPDSIVPVPRGALEILAREARPVPADSIASLPPAPSGRVRVEQLLERLCGVCSTPSGWMARCPAHIDSTPSLSIAETADGTILLFCHAGCQFDDIVQRLGLRPAQLFGSNVNSTLAPTRTIRDEYPTDQQLIHAAAYYQSCLSHDHVSYLAGQLGVSMQSLMHIGIGWSPENHAWTIPERRSDGNIIGVQLRYVDGQKRMVSGSHRGLILPGHWWTWSGTVFIPEGPSDVAALLSAGVQAIGRPSAASAPGLARLLLVRRRLCRSFWAKTTKMLTVLGRVETVPTVSPPNLPTRWAETCLCRFRPRSTRTCATFIKTSGERNESSERTDVPRFR